MQVTLPSIPEDFVEFISQAKGFGSKASFLPYGRTYSQYGKSKVVEQVTVQSKAPTKPKWVDPEDLYAVIGLDTLRWKATPDQIKKAYKEACLTWHPDRNVVDGHTDDTMFKAVQRAHEVLLDVKLRKLHDSNVDFSDSIPSYCEDKEFYNVYGPVFQNWSRWCAKDLPALGDEKTKWEDVDKFYSAWEKFSSWRDFTYNSEHKIESATSRDEKRWREKENEKQAKEEKRREGQRAIQLVENARNRDPRLKARRAHQAEEQKKKEVRKKEEEEKKILREIEKDKERAKIAEIEKQKEKEEKAKESLIKREAAQKIENSKSRFRDLCRPHVFLKGVKKFGIAGEDIEWCIGKLTIEELDDFFVIIEPFGKDEKTFVPAFNENLERIKTALQNKSKVKKEEEVKKQVDLAAEWSVIEITNLTRALKFHITGKDRWEKIRKDVKTKTIEEIQKKVAELKKKVEAIPSLDEKHHFAQFKDVKENKLEKGKVSDELIRKSEDATQNYDVKQWTKEEQTIFEGALKTHKDDSDKWEKISAKLGDKSPEDCKARFEHCKEIALKKKAVSK